MRAKINRGKRAGKSFKSLCRLYECNDFFLVIVESVRNGHREQAVEQFNMLSGPWQYEFMNYGWQDYGYYGKETRDLILEAIWTKG